jgi:hypothetical protein
VSPGDLTAELQDMVSPAGFEPATY